MALVPSWTLAFSATQVVATETTGTYNALTNPTGYGSPNPAFNDFEHIVFIKKKNVNNVADATVAGVYGPISDGGTYTASRSVDGWFELTNVNIPVWDSGTNYNGSGSATLSDYVFYNGVKYKAIQDNVNQNPETQTDYWEEISEEDFLLLPHASFDNNVYVTIEGRVTAYDADVYYANRIAEKTQLGFAGVAQTDRDKKRIDDIYRAVQQVLVADQLGNNTDGEWIVLRLQKMGAKRES